MVPPEHQMVVAEVRVVRVPRGSQNICQMAEILNSTQSHWSSMVAGSGLNSAVFSLYNRAAVQHRVFGQTDLLLSLEKDSNCLTLSLSRKKTLLQNLNFTLIY